MISGPIWSYKDIALANSFIYSRRAVDGLKSMQKRYYK